MTASVHSSRRPRLLSSIGRDELGASLPEVLVGTVIAALLMVGITSAIFTTTALQRKADDRGVIAAGFSLASLVLDRDGAMATAAAPARSQVAAVACTTAMDLGFLEGGASVRLQLAGTDLQRISGTGTRVVARNVSACTWRAEQEGTGRLAIRLDMTIAGPTGETASSTLRAAPRLW